MCIVHQLVIDQRIEVIKFTLTGQWVRWTYDNRNLYAWMPMPNPGDLALDLFYDINCKGFLWDEKILLRNENYTMWQFMRNSFPEEYILSCINNQFYCWMIFLYFCHAHQHTSENTKTKSLWALMNKAGISRTETKRIAIKPFSQVER